MPSALYYPFHLCHPKTLEQLLAAYETVHFRRYMALQLTPLTGTTAFPDQMGDTFPDLVRSGRLVQGHDVSGPIGDDLAAEIDRDLADPPWRSIFHEGLRSDRRFQRGLFDFSHSMTIAGRVLPGPAALLRLLDDRRAASTWTVNRVRSQTAAGREMDEEQGFEAAYGFAVLQTSAALWHTVMLARQHQLVAVTDSPVHFRLLSRTRERDRIPVEHAVITRQEY